MRAVILWTVAALAALVFGVAALCWVVSIRVTRPAGYAPSTIDAGLPVVQAEPDHVWQDVHRDPGQDLGLGFEAWSSPVGVDGEQLRGWWVPAPEAQGVVITVHGRASDRRDFLRHVPVFYSAGWSTLLFDLREHGVSSGAWRGASMGPREVADIRAVLDALDRQGVSGPRVVVGTSLGAVAAILAAAEDPRIAGVVAENAFASLADYVYDAAQPLLRKRSYLAPLLRPRWWSRWVAQITAWRMGEAALRAPIDVVGELGSRPLLLMHGEADRSVSWKHSWRLYEAAGSGRRWWLAPLATHTALFNRHPTQWGGHVRALLRQVAGVPRARAHAGGCFQLVMESGSC